MCAVDGVFWHCMNDVAMIISGHFICIQVWFLQRLCFDSSVIHTDMHTHTQTWKETCIHRSTSYCMNNLALRSNTGHMGTWLFVCVSAACVYSCTRVSICSHECMSMLMHTFKVFSLSLNTIESQFSLPWQSLLTCLCTNQLFNVPSAYLSESSH